MADFAGRTAFVSGGASGIGLACARALVAAGARVLIADVTGAAEAAAGMGAEGIALDVSDAAAVAQAFAGQAVSLAINAAGITGDAAAITDAADPDWERVVAVNLTGVRHCMKQQMTAMRAGGGGSIVNIASVMGLHGAANRAAYSAAKHGVVGLSKSAALEGAPYAIRVNALCPGFIDTPMLTAASDVVRDQVVARHPLGRLGTPEEVAAYALFLLSDAASFVTGSAVLVDGGYSAQ